MTELAPRSSLALLGISIPVLRTPREQWDTIVLSEGKRVREKACGLGEDKSWAAVTGRSCQERRQNCGEWEGPGERVPGAAQAGQALTGFPLLDAGLSLRTSDPAGPPRGSLSHKQSWAPPGRHGGSAEQRGLKPRGGPESSLGTNTRASVWPGRWGIPTCWLPPLSKMMAGFRLRSTPCRCYNK